MRAPTVIALIPARGGSKTIPRKNIRELEGMPLIAWTIETALSSVSLERVIVSTDDPEIAAIAERHGASVPFVRPRELAQDDTPDLPVYQHAMNWLAQNEDYQPDIVAWLRPTVPLRKVEDIESAINLLIETNADCVRSVCAVEHHPFWMKQLKGNHLLPFVGGADEQTYFRRQLLPPLYRLNGAVDVTWSERVMAGDLLFGGDVRGYVMPLERSVDIDNELDFALAALLLQRRGA